MRLLDSARRLSTPLLLTLFVLVIFAAAILSTISFAFLSAAVPQPAHDALSLDDLARDNHRFVLRHNKVHGFYFFTEVGIDGAQSLTGPHGSEFFQDGQMMKAEADFAVTEMNRALATKGTCDVIDVGANFGYFSMIAMSLGCRVFLFEPHEANFQLALLNFRLNGFTNFVAYNNPAGPESERQFNGWSFVFDPADTRSHKTIRTLPVAVVSRYTNQIDWFKLDVEGFENEVVKSIPNDMHISSMNVEVTWYLYKHIDNTALYDFLQQRFSKMVDPDRPHLASDSSNNLVAYKDDLDKTICDTTKIHFCQFNLLCSK